MKVRILTFAVVLSFLAINASVLDNVLAQKATKKKSGAVINRWYVFVSPDREFTLSFPTKPRREPNGQGLITIIRSYALNTENGMRFSINMQDIGGNPDARLNNEWDPDQDPLVAAAARQNGERVVQIHRLSKEICRVRALANRSTERSQHKLFEAQYPAARTGVFARLRIRD